MKVLMIKCQFFEITTPGGHESSRNQTMTIYMCQRHFPHYTEKQSLHGEKHVLGASMCEEIKK
jgi:hypothetical protein